MEMETINSVKFKRRGRRAARIAPVLLFAVLPLAAQPAPAAGDESAEREAAPPERPRTTDATSRRLIANYLAASGGRRSHDAVRNIRAAGTIDEAGKTRTFTLIETRDGQRRLSTKWRHLGRDYHEVRAFDGLVAWEQQLLPNRKEPEELRGVELGFFARQRWLLHPFVLPLGAKYVFDYQGKAKVKGRPAYIVSAWGPKNVRSWFYFDAGTFLVTRHGGTGLIAGVEEYLDYRATRFEYVDGILLPKEIELLAENDAFGRVIFEKIETNISLESDAFAMPPSRIPLLRSRKTGKD